MSDINFLGINENFPVPGQDNDTQVFRDNFDTIKQSLRIANEEITDLQDNTARTDQSSDFNNNLIRSAVLQNTAESKLDGGELDANEYIVSFDLANYFVLRFKQNTTIRFQEFPDSSTSPASVAKVRLELYSEDGSPKTITFGTSGGIVLKRANWPTSDNTIVVDSSETAPGQGNPHIVEVWQHDSKRIFLNYLGQFN
jgi:hypothetical protein